MRSVEQDQERLQRSVVLSLARLNQITHQMMRAALEDGLDSPALELLRQELQMEEAHLSALFSRRVH